MDRNEIFTAIAAERNYQDTKWGTGFDDKNTPNDWVSYITTCASHGCTFYVTPEQFTKAMIDVAAIAVAAIEALERTGELAKRHYD